MEKYRNRLLCSTKAYEILLDREMRFYECMESILAELIPLVHDLLYYMNRDKEVYRKDECEAFRTCFGRYIELVKDMKNKTLIHQSYIPQTIFVRSPAVVKRLQDDYNYWYEMAKYLFDGEYEKIDYDKGKCTVDDVLLYFTKFELSIKERLEELSELKKGDYLYEHPNLRHP